MRIYDESQYGRHKDGTEVPIDIMLSPLQSSTGNQILSVVRDITSRRAAEAQLETQRIQLISSARLVALGTMAGGVAHEINNPLAIVHASAANLLRLAKEEGDVPAKEVIKHGERIRETAVRISKIVTSLRQISREGSLDSISPTPVAKIVEQVLEICNERFRHHGIELRLPSIAPGLYISCRQVQIEQVLLNLVQNAFDAVMEQAEERWVRLDVAVRDRQAIISVQDSGPGVPEELKTRIMEPFFTTKPVGRGTGLGLSLSRIIVEEHGGKLELTEEAGHTCFSFQLPLAAITESTCS